MLSIAMSEVDPGAASPPSAGHEQLNNSLLDMVKYPPPVRDAASFDWAPLVEQIAALRPGAFLLHQLCDVCVRSRIPGGPLRRFRPLRFGLCRGRSVALALERDILVEPQSIDLVRAGEAGSLPGPLGRLQTAAIK